jgi:ribosomal 30S subunit maturation factor RimM
MRPTFRTKFQVQDITSYHWSPTLKKVTLRAIQEDEQRITAELSIFVSSPSELEQLEPGKFFYVDIAEVEPVAATETKML